MLEKIIERYLAQQVLKHNGISFKFSSPAHRGVPDRIVIFNPNSVYFVEVKAPTGKLSRLQIVCLDELAQMGCKCWVVYSKDDVDEFLRHVKDEQEL